MRRNIVSSMPVAIGTSSLNSLVTPEALENAAKEVDRQITGDRQYPELAEQINVSQGGISFSGVNDYDYPFLSSPSVGLAGMELVSLLKRVPLPAELVEQFDHMQCNCMMGLFSEIRRAWLTIDSDIFVWNYEDGSDLAYFDGLSETILCAGLVKPKPEILRESVRYILCLTTPIDIILLAVTFRQKRLGTLGLDDFAEMHLRPDPLFSIPSDNIYLTCMTGTHSGRIFLGGKDGCVYEVIYQAADSWFQRKCRKVNHSSGALSFLVPSFLNATFSGEDPIAQLAVDNTRNILFSRSERGTIQVFDLGFDGNGMTYVASLSQDKITHKAASATRTIDRNHFTPVIHIAPVPRNESKTVHLVAITQAGVRLYFTTTTARVPLERPSKLELVHTRLPPGFAPSAASQRPSQVHTAFYRQGILLLASSQAEDIDVLWGISPDPFPFQCPLKEMQVTVPMEGRTWSLSEVPEFGGNMISDCPIVSDRWPDPPAVVRQHATNQRCFVALSAQGSYLFTTYRPVEQLRQLLLHSQGYDSEAVQAFFKLHREDQACATCLVLACSPQTSQKQVSEWATRALFKCGMESSGISTTGHPAATSGRPTMGSPVPRGTLAGSYIASPGGPGRPAFGSPGFATSTPQVGVGQAVIRPGFTRSSKHDGLCMYFARILETIWDGRLVFEDFFVPHHSEPQQPTPVLRSLFNAVQLGWILEKLRQLQSWMENNMQLMLTQLDGGFPRVTMPGGQSQLQQTHQDSFAAEKNFLINFKSLIDRSIETLMLWQVLNEHNFEDVVLHLEPVMKDRLKHSKFRDLLTSGKEICSALINSLIRCYYDDIASTDAISERLRDVCPNLFSRDDAVSTKAGELLVLAERSRDKTEQERILRDSLQCYRRVTDEINLEGICSMFESVRFYEGIVELALHEANKRDAQGLALHFYGNGEPHADIQGEEAFIARQQCYKCILDILQRLLVLKTSASQSPGLPSRPGPPPAPDPNALTSSDAEKHMEEMLSFSLTYGDELWHVMLYQWLIDNALTDRLLEIKSPHLETFLKRSSAAQNPNELKILNLLWRYYEKTKNYSAAARVLSKLSEKESPDVTLELRLEYLSRAIMSAKSSNLRTSVSGEGEFLHELEEKLEVARIQMQVYEALMRIKTGPAAAHLGHALAVLNSRLMDITTLYGDFADAFSLAECKLAIVHCAGHYDPTLIETLWRDIIDKELLESERSSPSDRMTIVSKKIASLGKMYVHSERYFPLGAIVLMLEKKSAELNWDPTWVFMTMLDIGIPFPVLHGIYDRLFKAKDPCWQALNRPLHILEVIYHLLSKFVDTPSLSPLYERPSFTTSLYDACATYLVDLESTCSRDSNVQDTLVKFKGLQARLKRLL
ncbi:nuclear pore complex protein Nup155-like [Acropora palmata]|uniref:nuclear pore complex protein Nup155-like n=1 Tax=Acropora palmata TaxID=6131 RepID=UPI003DA0D2EF